MMSPYQFNRLSHRARLQASLSGLGLTPGPGMLEVKAPSGAVTKAMTVSAPSLLKANIGVALTAPTIKSSIAATPGSYATAPSQTFLNLKTGTGADPQPFTRGSQSQVNLQPAVVKVLSPLVAVPASDAPTAADTISKGVRTMSAPMPTLKDTFLGQPQPLAVTGKPRFEPVRIPNFDVPTEPTFVAKPRTSVTTPAAPTSPPTSTPVANAIDKVFGSKNDGSAYVPYDISEAKLPPGTGTTATAAPQAPAAFAPNPLLIAGGVLALGVVVYLATR